MAVRTIMFTPQEYFFVLQIVLGEQPNVAYASVYDTAEFRRNVPSENEVEYLEKFQKDAEWLLGQQQCQQLMDYIEGEYKSVIQSEASNLEEYDFTGKDIKKLLTSLLHDRSQELSEASVRDILGLVKSLFENGYLDSDDNWSRHFITVPKKYDAMCCKCNHELYCVEGVDIVCKHCGSVYKWSEEMHRFFPEFQHL